MSFLAKKMVLVVDGNEKDLAKVSEFFKSEGSKVYEAENSSRGLWFANGEAFDIVVLEYKLPGMSGSDLVGNIRSSGRGTKTKFVVLSNHLSAAAILELSQVKVHVILSKPFNKDTVREKLEVLFAPPPEQPVKKAPTKYDPNLVKCFIMGVGEVLTEYFSAKPVIGKPVPKKGQRPQDLVTGMIAFHGQGSFGSMSFSIEKDFLPGLAEKIFMGNKVDLTPEMTGDIAGELCNQVLGRVKIRLKAIGVNIHIGLPEVFNGENHTIPHRSQNPVICIHMSYDGKGGTVEFTMEDGVSQGQTGDTAEESAIDDIGLWA